jgi:uncharacterized paraquat-inducible protein A
MKGLSLVLLALLLASCVVRVPAYAPRLTNTDQHRTAVAPRDCLDCHDITRRQTSHAANDNCVKCHPLCKGC